MNNNQLEKLQNAMVTQMYQAASRVPITTPSVINKCHLRFFGNLIRQKRLANVKTLLPHTIQFLTINHQLTTVLRDFFNLYPQQKLDFFTNAQNFYDCLSNHTFKDHDFYAKALTLAAYEKALIHAVYYSDHITAYSSMNKIHITLNQAAQTLNLSYDIRPLILSNNYKADLVKLNLRLLICWDYRNNRIRLFELTTAYYYLLTHLDQLTDALQEIRYSEFWQTLFRINALEITL